MSCIANTAQSLPCGGITLASQPLTLPPAGWPANVPFTDSALFTATGHLNVGEGFDVQGWGTVVGTICPLCEVASSTNVRYTFSVAEPSTLLLLAGGIVALVGTRRARTVRLRRFSD